MSKPTLLSIVQDILREMNSDEVNSIFDTEESEQVANHVKRAYTALMSNSKWAHTKRFMSLTPFSDSRYPTHMTVQDQVKSVVAINYNIAGLGETKKYYRPVEYLKPDHFLAKLNKRDSDSSTVDVIVDPSGVELLIVNNKHPDYYTSFDDTTLVFDSYDNEVDTTLQESKVQMIAYIMPEFTLSDSFVPDLPIDVFTLLTEEALSRCQLRIRESSDPKAEQEAGRQRRWASRESWRVNKQSTFPNYGRKR